MQQMFFILWREAVFSATQLPEERYHEYQKACPDQVS